MNINKKSSPKTVKLQFNRWSLNELIESLTIFKEDDPPIKRGLTKEEYKDYQKINASSIINDIKSDNSFEKIRQRNAKNEGYAILKNRQKETEINILLKNMKADVEWTEPKSDFTQNQHSVMKYKMRPFQKALKWLSKKLEKVNAL